MCIFTYTLYAVVSNGKQEMEAQENLSLIRLPFAHRADGNLSLVRLLMKKHLHMSTCIGPRGQCM